VAFAPALGLIGAAVSAGGTIMGGISQQNMYNYQAKVASNNAIIAEQNAVYAAHAGDSQATQESLKEAEKGAKVKGALAANGVDVNSGSAVDVQESQREEGKLNTENVKANANLQVYGYRTQEASFKAQENLDKAAAENAVPGALLGATGGLLSNASAIGMRPGGAQFFNDIGSLFTTA